MDFEFKLPPEWQYKETDDADEFFFWNTQHPDQFFFLTKTALVAYGDDPDRLGFIIDMQRKMIAGIQD